MGLSARCGLHPLTPLLLPLSTRTPVRDCVVHDVITTLTIIPDASIVVEVVNEGLPRGVWSTTTDRTALPLEARLAQILTLITVQTTLGLCLTVAFVIAAPSFVGAFVPGTVRSISVRYVRISSGSLVASTLETAVSLGTRALDHPE
jgi:hypothetical protein